MAPKIIRTLVVVAVLAFLLAVSGLLSARYVLRNGYQGVTITGPDMLPTLEPRHHYLFNTMVYKLASPKPGEVVVFHFPNDPTRELVKRVIGVPGDEVSIQGGTVFISGEPLNEPYIAAQDSSNMDSVQLQEKQYFVLGDNRPASVDSRHWGPVPEENIFGRLGNPFYVP